MPDATSPSTRRRIIDAALAAERDRSGTLAVADLAEHAGMSDKHFQRRFRAVIGESPKSYLRRLRLQHAAYLLKWSDAGVLDIATITGFDTHSGFTRAFSKAYGQSPTEFRKRENVAPFLRAPQGTRDQLSADDIEATRLVVRIEKTASLRVAAMRHIGPVEKTADVWPAMIDWARGRGLLNAQSQLLGIHNDYWDAAAEDRYRYDAAIVVPDDFEADDAVGTFQLAAGEVAMTEFAGSIDDADAAWRRFADQWLPVSGYQIRTNFAYDIYPIEIFEGGVLKQLLQTLTGIRATLCLPIR